MADNKRVRAKAQAVTYWAHEWGLSGPCALVKFEHQSPKWRKKQVNRFMREGRID